jgi:hypothetical protein
MQLLEVFEQLTAAELSQISIGGDTVGSVDTKNLVKLIPHINLALTALYKRFPLKEGRCIVVLEADKYTYPLSVKDLLKVEQVLTEDGVNVGLNDSSDKYSCFTPSASVLRVAKDIVNGSTNLSDQYKTSKLEVIYRANHPKLITEDVDYTDDIIELPETHLEPLLLYIASRIHNPIGMTGEFNAGNNYAAKYERSCMQIEVANLMVDQGSQNDRLSQRGWV